MKLLHTMYKKRIGEMRMNTLLIFFAIPVATIILAIVLQKVLNSPLLVAGTFFAIFLIITFAAFDVSFLVIAILYTLLAFITAILARFICCLIHNSDNPCLKNIANAEICADSDSENDDDNNNSGCGCNRSVSNQYYGRRYMMRR